LSYKDSLITSTTVLQDSTFEVQFECSKIEKVVLKADKNQGVLFVQPNAIYQVSIPDRDPYNAYRPYGNQLEIGFFDLNNQDINYKILEFNQWKTNFLASNFSLKSTKTKQFSNSLDTFKLSVQNYYQSDTSTFFKTYVRYSIAVIDDINFLGSRSHYDKFDFYLKDFPVAYDNEMYMKYFQTLRSMMDTTASRMEVPIFPWNTLVFYVYVCVDCLHSSFMCSCWLSPACFFFK
jgi:hypothetical protein